MVGGAKDRVCSFPRVAGADCGLLAAEGRGKCKRGGNTLRPPAARGGWRGMGGVGLYMRKPPHFAFANSPTYKFPLLPLPSPAINKSRQRARLKAFPDIPLPDHISFHPPPAPFPMATGMLPLLISSIKREASGRAENNTPLAGPQLRFNPHLMRNARRPRQLLL